LVAHGTYGGLPEAIRLQLAARGFREAEGTYDATL
jgi:hypothetical protein